MNKTAKLLRSTLAALLIGALSIPGVALARDHDGYRGGGDRQERHERYDRHSRHNRHYDGRRGHWRKHEHGRRGHRERVVVREPVYVAPRHAVVAAPLWPSVTGGISLVLGTGW